MGQKLMSVSANTFAPVNTVELNVADLALGNYLIRLLSGEGELVKKLVIAR
jgi:hypothetical protein